MDVNPMSQKIDINKNSHNRKSNMTPTTKREPENKTARVGPTTQSYDKTEFLPDRKGMTMPSQQNQTMNADQ